MRTTLPTLLLSLSLALLVGCAGDDLAPDPIDAAVPGGTCATETEHAGVACRSCDRLETCEIECPDGTTWTQWEDPQGPGYHWIACLDGHDEPQGPQLGYAGTLGIQAQRWYVDGQLDGVLADWDLGPQGLEHAEGPSRACRYEAGELVEALVERQGSVCPATKREP